MTQICHENRHQAPNHPPTPSHPLPSRPNPTPPGSNPPLSRSTPPPPRQTRRHSGQPRRRPGHSRPRPVIPAKAGIHAHPKPRPFAPPARSFPRNWKDGRRPVKPAAPRHSRESGNPRPTQNLAPLRPRPLIPKKREKRWTNPIGKIVAAPAKPAPHPVIPAKAGIHAPPKTSPLCAPARSFPRKEKSDGPTQLER